MLSYRQYKNRVKSLYIENKSVTELENIVEIKDRLEHFYLTEKDNLSFDILNKRRQKLKTLQLFETTNYLSLFIGIVAGIAANEIYKLGQQPTFSGSLAIIVSVTLFVCILFYICIQNASNMYMTNRREYCEPFELEFIDSVIKCQEDELKASKITQSIVSN